MDFPEGPIEQLEDDGAEVEVEELQSLDIESVAEPGARRVRRSRGARPDRTSVACPSIRA